MRFYVIITLLCVTLVSAAAQDHLATLGISEGRAKEAVFDSFMSDAVSIAGKPAAFTAMSPDARVAVVNFALNLARTFVESDDFKRRYADHREANGPDPLPEEQTAEWRTEMPEWDQFVADIQASRAEWNAHRAAGGRGLPPGWVTRSEYEQQRRRSV